MTHLEFTQTHNLSEANFTRLAKAYSQYHGTALSEPLTNDEIEVLKKATAFQSSTSTLSWTEVFEALNARANLFQGLPVATPKAAKPTKQTTPKRTEPKESVTSTVQQETTDDTPEVFEDSNIEGTTVDPTERIIVETVVSPDQQDSKSTTTVVTTPKKAPRKNPKRRQAQQLKTAVKAEVRKAFENNQEALALLNKYQHLLPLLEKLEHLEATLSKLEQQPTTGLSERVTLLEERDQSKHRSIKNLQKRLTKTESFAATAVDHGRKLPHILSTLEQRLRREHNGSLASLQEKVDRHVQNIATQKDLDGLAMRMNNGVKSFMSTMTDIIDEKLQGLRPKEGTWLGRWFQ